jgi:hypothetical protein
MVLEPSADEVSSCASPTDVHREVRRLVDGRDELAERTAQSRKHRQLLNELFEFRLVNILSSEPTIHIGKIREATPTWNLCVPIEAIDGGCE